MDVKSKTHLVPILALSISLALLSGCATNSSTSSGSGTSGSRFKSTDGRVVDIGTATPVNNGKLYLNPHMEKAWVADGFNFQGYDTLYIAPTASTATFNEDEVRPHGMAKERLV